MGENNAARPRDAVDHAIDKAMNPAMGTIAPGMVFQLNGLVFKISYINPGKKRFTAALLTSGGKVPPQKGG